MNCDQAFDALTDPARRDSDDLHRHLEQCPRCRQMQDVLAPALELLAPTPDTRGFTEDAGLELDRKPAAILTAESILLAERTAADLARQTRTQTQSRKRLTNSLLRYAAVFLLGAGLTFGVSALSGQRSRVAAEPSAGSFADCLWVQNREQPRSGFGGRSQVVVASCVGCHRSGSLHQ